MLSVRLRTDEDENISCDRSHGTALCLLKSGKHVRNCVSCESLVHFQCFIRRGKLSAVHSLGSKKSIVSSVFILKLFCFSSGTSINQNLMVI